MTGLLTFFGSLNAAVPFLLDLFRIPADTFQLFLATGVINSRVGTLLAAVHTLTVAVLGTCAITGMLHVRKGARACGTSRSPLRSTIAVIGGARALFDGYLRTEYTKDEVLGAHAPAADTRRVRDGASRLRSRRTRQRRGPLLQGIRAAWRAARRLPA